MESFAVIFNNKKPVNIVAKLSDLDLCWDRGYASAILIPANVYLFKVNNSTRKRCEICSKLTIKTPE